MFIGPPLERVAITVGRGAYDGTADSVILKFKNGDGETCLTEGKALITNIPMKGTYNRETKNGGSRRVMRNIRAILKPV